MLKKFKTIYYPKMIAPPVIIKVLSLISDITLFLFDVVYSANTLAYYN